MIYPPGKDSFLLQKYIKLYVKQNSKVLDMGTGSGIQGKEALKYTKDVLSSDINKECLKNLEGIKTIHSDLFKKIKGKFDLIMFNPPYLPEDIREDVEGKVALCGGKEGYEIIFRFLEQAKSHLKKDGKILLVFSSLSKKGLIEEKMKDLKYSFEILESEKFFFETIYVYLIGKSNN